MKTISLIIGCLLLASGTQAQFSVLDSIFFEEAAIQYQTWLEQSEASKAIVVSDFQLDSNKVQLKLQANTRTEWLTIRSNYFDAKKHRFGKRLLKEMAFYFEVPLDSASILIECDNDTYDVHIYYENEAIVIDELFGLDIRLKSAVPIAFKEVGVNGVGPIIVKNKSLADLEILKQSITGRFQTHYEAKEQFWNRKAKFEVLELDNEFSIEITNISKEVLDDFSIGYFEFIIIDVFVEPKGKDIEIIYNFRGKYGSGIFIAPRRSGYKDMNGKYEEYVKRYDKKVRKMLIDVVMMETVRN
jgi:hypothetical protein